MIELETYIFIGRSGCGKGTQAKIIADQLMAKGQPILYLETGDYFRKFIASGSYSSNLAKQIMERADRQPDFLAVWTGAGTLVEKFQGNEHMIFDGTPRSLKEAEMLDTAMKFYNRQKVNIIYIDISRQSAKDRMIKRGRNDDHPDDIEKRLDWFDSDVLPAVEYYRQQPDYNLVEVNGDQPVEAVTEEIISKL